MRVEVETDEALGLTMPRKFHFDWRAIEVSKSLISGSAPTTAIATPFQIRSATGQHRRDGGVSGGGKGRGQGL